MKGCLMNITPGDMLTINCPVQGKTVMQACSGAEYKDGKVHLEACILTSDRLPIVGVMQIAQIDFWRLLPEGTSVLRARRYGRL